MGVKDMATTSIAMRIVRLDRNKFNQAVADGHYPCAPGARPGARRIFDLPDLIGLWFFARHTEEGETARRAGETACSIAAGIRREPNTSRVAFARGVYGGVWAGLTDSYMNLDATKLDGHPLQEVHIFYIDGVREMILQALAVEDRIVGSDDD